MDVGRRLKHFREAKGFSIYRLSEETYVSQGHISDLENGRNQPTIETLRRLLAPMGITLSEFFSEGGEPVTLSENERGLLEAYRTMSDDKARVFEQLGKILEGSDKV